MKLGEFARLCGVSAPMISKYKKAGLLVIGDEGVNAIRSLARLQGHLDEAKRVRAVLELGEARVGLPQAEERPAAPPPGEAAPASAVIVELATVRRDLEDARLALADRADKARREKAEAELKEIELAQAKGELVEAKEVRRALQHVMQIVVNEWERTTREDAEFMAAALGLDAVTARRLQNKLKERDHLIRANFAAALRRFARENAGGDVELDAIG